MPRQDRPPPSSGKPVSPDGYIAALNHKLDPGCRDWDAALRTAKAENKPVCVVVYANWCARCRELAPVFQTPQVVSAAAGLVMGRQDQDEAAAWLEERLGAVRRLRSPRHLLDPSGAVRDDLQSGHPRHPYFYAPLVTDRLLGNMHAASRR